MKHFSALRPSPALLVACAALVMAMSGAAVALPGKGKVKANDIAKGAVKSKAIADGAVRNKEVKSKSLNGNRLKDGAVKARQIAEGTITSDKVAPDGLTSGNIRDYKTASTGIVTATDGVDRATAREAAPPQELFAKGDLSIYAKCYRDTTNDRVWADVFIATSQNGAIFDGDDELNGDPDFLDTDTAEADRALESNTDAATDSAVINEGEFTAMAPDGTGLTGQVGAAAKNGTLAGGNGLYGDGNVCLFTLSVSG